MKASVVTADPRLPDREEVTGQSPGSHRGGPIEGGPIEIGPSIRARTLMPFYRNGTESHFQPVVKEHFGRVSHPPEPAYPAAPATANVKARILRDFAKSATELNAAVRIECHASAAAPAPSQGRAVRNFREFPGSSPAPIRHFASPFEPKHKVSSSSLVPLFPRDQGLLGHVLSRSSASNRRGESLAPVCFILRPPPFPFPYFSFRRRSKIGPWRNPRRAGTGLKTRSETRTTRCRAVHRLGDPSRQAVWLHR